MLMVRALLHQRRLLEQTAPGRILARWVDDSSPAEVERALLPLLFAFLLEYRPRRRALGIWNDFQQRRRVLPVIGVHFRSGGEGAWSDPVMDDVTHIASVHEAIVAVAERRFGGDCQVLVTADSANVRARIMGLLAGRYPATTYEGQAWHYERSRAGAVDPIDFAIAEFMCLSECDYVIHGRGNYAMTAALLGGRPHEAYWNVAPVRRRPSELPVILQGLVRRLRSV
jgi:hypothetical protein